MSPFRQRPLRPLLAALGLAVVLGGCDFSDDDDDVIVGPDVVLVRFSFDGDQYQLSADGLIASFESDAIEDASERRDVQDAVAGAADGALVLLYVDGGLVFDGGEGTWAALPVTSAYEAVSDDGTPYVDYTIMYACSCDDADLYYDAFSSAQLDFDTVFPCVLDFRLVVAPASAFAVAGAEVDLRDYEAVRRALDLPE